MNFTKFSLSRVVAPHISFDDFLSLSQSVGVDAIEILCSDVPDIDNTDLAKCKSVLEQCQNRNLKILALNALFPFDIWNKERETQAIKLFKTAQALQAAGVVCWPLNDANDNRSDTQRKQDLRTALTGLKKIASEYGVKAYIEPVGFFTASMRFKPDAVEAIDAIGGKDIIQLVHDTFHHYLSSETQFFPEYTGLAHISGVIDASLPLEKIRDEDRYLVDDKDVLKTVDQLKHLWGHGYTGYATFEPFAPTVQNSSTIADDLKTSIEFIKKKLAK